MKRLLAGLGLALFAAEAQAGVLSCSFTEPFFNITYDSATGVVTWISADDSDPDTGKPIPRILAKTAKLELLDYAESGQKLRLVDAGKTLLDLQVTMQADDGMSDSTYPMEGKYGSNTGGCYTDKFPPFNPYEMLEGLGLKP
jgi:hypothetical protein